MIVDNGKYYLYRHIRLDKNEPFYIGIGKKSKKQGTYNRAYTHNGRNIIWNGIAKKSSIEVEILLETNDIDFLVSKEIEFISLYGKIIENTGTLSNMQDGGKYAFEKKTQIKKGHPEYDKRVERFNAINKSRVGTNNFNSLSRKVYAYNSDGVLVKGFDSGVKAAEYLGDCSNSNALLTKVDTNRNYHDFYFFSYEVPKVDASKFKFRQWRKDFTSKKVCKIDDNGEVVEVYATIKEAAEKNNRHKVSFSQALYKGRKMRCGNFKFYSEVNK